MNIELLLIKIHVIIILLDLCAIRESDFSAFFKEILKYVLDNRQLKVVKANYPQTGFFFQ